MAAEDIEREIKNESADHAGLFCSFGDLPACDLPPTGQRVDVSPEKAGADVLKRARPRRKVWFFHNTLPSGRDFNSSSAFLWDGCENIPKIFVILGEYDDWV